MFEHRAKHQHTCHQDWQYWITVLGQPLAPKIQILPGAMQHTITHFLNSHHHKIPRGNRNLIIFNRDKPTVGFRVSNAPGRHHPPSGATTTALPLGLSWGSGRPHVASAISPKAYCILGKAFVTSITSGFCWKPEITLKDLPKAAISHWWVCRAHGCRTKLQVSWGQWWRQSVKEVTICHLGKYGPGLQLIF